jgi:hypothetical protein
VAVTKIERMVFIAWPVGTDSNRAERAGDNDLLDALLKSGPQQLPRDD